MGLPQTWAEVLDRLSRALGSPETRDAEEWLREAVEARWGTSTLHELDRGARQIAFQKASGVLLALEEAGLPDELVDPDGVWPRWLLYRDGTLEPAEGYEGRRASIQAALARYFGVSVEGPPWRIGPLETDRPSYDEYAASANFG